VASSDIAKQPGLSLQSPKAWPLNARPAPAVREPAGCR